MATADSTEPSACPQVRDACEECHSRKIKCHTTKAGACRACQNNGRLCFFLPRNKSGRPKVGEDGNKEDRRSNAAALGSTAAAAAAAMAEHAAMVESGNAMSSQQQQQQQLARTRTHSTPSPKSSPRSNTQQSNNIDTNTMRPHIPTRSMSDTNLEMGFPCFENMDWPNQLHPVSTNEFMDMDMDLDLTSFQYQDFPAECYFEFQRPDNIPMAPSQHSHSASYPSLGSLPSIPSTEFNFNRAPASASGSFFSTPISTMPASSMLALGEQKGPEGCFSTLLGHINRLQRCLEKVRSGKLFSHPHTRHHQLTIVISTIDSSCMATCSTLKDQFQVVLSQRSEAKMNGTNMDFRAPSAVIRPDQSLIALAITAILTVARLCQALMRSELPDAQSSLDNMLLLNRLGCNILQTRIALVNIEKLDRGLKYLTEDATREISIVHTEFENMKKNAGNNNPSY
ncbi:hypothetical protein EDD36DRAFT_413809 [Exophiala viscosa]|uniref:Zn(2)-C6 fungal-type domain-containing protein n=1 Tax=Exophiala viscosa TaxID=2486360 RepID=A0AAN6E606_9EURO|nr:hypothetical protein EDD36DRAFT_413809 [Exophiala viscosa]